MMLNMNFLNSFKSPELLSAEETYNLFQKVKSGDKEAKKKLAEHNLGLVFYEVSHKFKTVNYDKDDIISIGVVGLMKAISTYNVEKKVYFPYYAIKCIDNEILLFLRKLKKISTISSLNTALSTDEKGNKLTIEDTLINKINIEEEYCVSETYRIINQILNGLSKRDREIIKLRFGFYNGRVYTQEEIAKKISVSQSYVSRLLIVNVKKIGLLLQKEGVIELRNKKNQIQKSNKKSIS